MATKKLNDTFGVTVEVKVQINLDVQAENLEEALSKSRGLKIGDVLTAKGDIFDYDKIKVVSLWANS